MTFVDRVLNGKTDFYIRCVVVFLMGKPIFISAVLLCS
jgi:hypothetical protein